MTSTEMLARVRTILDESSASFWTDAEIYAALADGQNEVIKLLLSIYVSRRRIDPDVKLPYELESVLYDASAVSNPVTIPAGFLELISATYDHNGTGGQKPCKIIDIRGVNFDEDNTFFAATENDPKVYKKSASGVMGIYFLPAASGTPAITFHYIKSPADIAAGQNALLPVTTHNAIVHFAVSRMFQKDQRPQESQIYFNLFIENIKPMLGV